MKKRKFWKVLIGICLFMLAMPAVKAGAASATMTIDGPTEEVMVGDTFSVVLMIESDDSIGNVETFVSFDDKKMSFMSGGIYATGGDGMILISDWDSNENGTRKKYSLKFKALKQGEASVYVSGEPQVFSSEDSTAMSVSSNRFLVTIMDPDSLSSNTSLKSLSVAEGQLSPGFDKEQTQYSLSVGKTTMNLTIKAKAEDKDATVTISGNENFKEGENKVIIHVEAPSGKAKQYILNVTKQAYNTVEEGLQTMTPTQSQEGETVPQQPSQQMPETEATVQETAPAEVEEGFHAREENGELYLTQSNQIRVVEPEDDVKIPAGYIRTNIRVDDTTIPVYTLKDDLENPLLLIYGMNQNGETGFYQYNRENGTLQKYNTDFVGSEENISNEEMEEASGRSATLFLAIGVLCIICALLTIVVILLYLRLKEKEAKDRDDFFAI